MPKIRATCKYCQTVYTGPHAKMLAERCRKLGQVKWGHSVGQKFTHAGTPVRITQLVTKLIDAQHLPFYVLWFADTESEHTFSQTWINTHLYG